MNAQKNLSKKSDRKFIRVFEDIDLTDNVFFKGGLKGIFSRFHNETPNEMLDKTRNKTQYRARDESRNEIRDEIYLNDKNSHYLLRVMRRKIGDYIRVFNGQYEWIAKIVSVSNKIAKVKLIEMVSIDASSDSESEEIRNKGRLKKDDLKKEDLNVGVILCPIKSHRFATVIEKITEIGVNEIFFVRSKNTIISEVNIYKVKCWIEEAMKQSNGLIFPKLPQVQMSEVESSNQTTPLTPLAPIIPFAALARKNDNDKKILNLSSIKQFFNDYFINFTSADCEKCVSLNENSVSSSESGVCLGEENALERINDLRRNDIDTMKVVIILDKGHENILNVLKKNFFREDVEKSSSIDEFNETDISKYKNGLCVNSVYILAGPEGGFSREEKKYFDELSDELSDDRAENDDKKYAINSTRHGIRNNAKIKILFASMGNTNLRSETATILALGIVKNFFDSVVDSQKNLTIRKSNRSPT